MSIDDKRAILPNNFETESKLLAKAHENASSDAAEVEDPPDLARPRREPVCRGAF
jgi:hypothetical protein